MKKAVIIAASLMAACNSSQKAVEETSKTVQTTAQEVVFASSITEAELKEHLYTYASDDFEGRETGKPGQKKAVEYLIKEYKELGLKAAKSNGDFKQEVPLEVTHLPTGSIDINGVSFNIGTDFVSFDSKEGEITEIIYVGYGIEEENYSDYKGLDVKGKLILVKTGEPKKADGTYEVSGTLEKSKWSNLSESISKRTDVAKEKGAAGMLFLDPNNFPRLKARFDYYKTNSGGQMDLKNPNKKVFSSFYINEKMAKSILPNITTNHTPKNITTLLNLKVKGSNEDVLSENVAAIIKGSEKPNEYIIVSSHLDHIGINSKGEINNGADDDGSGTVALLEIAEAFKKAADAGHGLKGLLYFLHVTGEEKGLLGSKYYTDISPIVPLANTVANLNIDMIGRIDPNYKGDRNYLYLIGADKLSSELHQLSEDVNKKYSHIEFDYTYNDENDPNRFYYRSDHYNFAKNNIPIIFYFNGTHADYHKPTDTPDKINYDLLTNRTKLIFHTAWEIANRDKRLIVDKVAK